MTVPEVVVDPRVVEVLGRDGIAAACAQLWPVDCVSCGGPLGAEPPELWISRAGPGHRASLSHAACAPPYGEMGMFFAGVSWRMTVFTFNGTPAILLNPSAERVLLHPAGSGWRVSPELEFPGAGLMISKLGFSLRTNDPLHIEPLRLTDRRLEIRLGGAAYSADTTSELADGIRRNDGCLLVITHALLADFTLGDLLRALTGRQAAIGWAAMNAAGDRLLADALTAVTTAVAAHVPPPVPAAARPLLRLGPGEQALVELLASARVEDTPAWIAEHSPAGARLLPWREWSPDGGNRRWRTHDPLTATAFELLFDGAYARLYRQEAHARPPDGADDENLFAWARLVLGRPARWTELPPTGQVRWFAEAA